GIESTDVHRQTANDRPAVLRLGLVFHPPRLRRHAPLAAACQAKQEQRKSEGRAEPTHAVIIVARSPGPWRTRGRAGLMWSAAATPPLCVGGWGAAAWPPHSTSPAATARSATRWPRCRTCR